MEIAISQRLYNKPEVLLNNVEAKSGLGSANPKDLRTFLNILICDLNETYSDLNINSITTDSGIKIDERISDMYVIFVKDNDNIIAEVFLANADKFGNTVITQQMMSHLIKRLDEDADYLKDKTVKKIVYLTLDINYKNEGQQSNLRTIDVLIRTLKTLDIDVIYLKSTTLEYTPYKDVQELLSDLEELKKLRSNNDPDKGIFIEVKNQGVNDIVFKVDNMKGQDSKYYGFFLLGILALSRPNLRFEITKDKNIADPDETLKRIAEIYDSNFTSNLKEILIPIPGRALARGNGINKLIYGAPGTGKSYDLNTIYENYYRVTFYSDFDYSQFVGGLFPTRNEEGQIDYQFIPGMFTQALIVALKNPGEKFGIIVEELNRANPASTFGDVFQLLDRNSAGISEYSIHNTDLAKYIDEKTDYDYNFTENGLRLPGNFDIIATMNPADQGVYTVDAAFKRRWVQEYKAIDWNHENICQYYLDGFNAKWPHVGKTINQFLIEKFKIDEDMLLGHFFLKDSDFSINNRYEDKLIGYLWNDVARYNRDVLFLQEFGTLSEILIAHANKNQIFVDSLHKKLSEDE